jgi:hypothetical protein
MPRPVSTQILIAKKLGNRFNLIRINLSTPVFLTDNTFDYTYQSNNYEANGLLLGVDSGAMTAGVEANDWEVELSAVLDEVYSGMLSSNLSNRDVFHYVAYFEENETGINIIGVESKKYGQILSLEDSDDENRGSVTFTITGPLGNTEMTNEVKTNNLSQERRWGPDKIFQFAHETDFTIPRTDFGGGFIGSLFGTVTSSIPSDVE